MGLPSCSLLSVLSEAALQDQLLFCSRSLWLLSRSVRPCGRAGGSAMLVACLRDICRQTVLLWKLTKLLRTASSLCLCPRLLQLSNNMWLFTLLKMHFLREAFFPCFGSICGVYPLLTAVERGCIDTEVFAKWIWISCWWFWERHCTFYSLRLLVVEQKWRYWLLLIALWAVDKRWHVRMREYGSPSLNGSAKEAE